MGPRRCKAPIWPSLSLFDLGNLTFLGLSFSLPGTAATRHKQDHGHPAVLQSGTCCRKQTQILGNPSVVRLYFSGPASLCFIDLLHITTTITASFVIPRLSGCTYFPLFLCLTHALNKWQLPPLAVADFLPLFLGQICCGLARPHFWAWSGDSEPPQPGAKCLLKSSCC